MRIPSNITKLTDTMKPLSEIISLVSKNVKRKK